MRTLRRVFFLPVAEAEDRERRLLAIEHRTDSAQRTLDHATSRLRKTSDRLLALTAEVISRNEEASD